MKFHVARAFVGCLAALSALAPAQAAPPLELRVAPGAAPGAAMTLGMRYQLSAQTRLSFDTEISRAAAFSAANRSRPLALELASSSTLQGLARGTLMRAQLNADSSLMLRLRDGRLGLYLAVRLTGSE